MPPPTAKTWLLICWSPKAIPSAPLLSVPKNKSTSKLKGWFRLTSVLFQTAPVSQFKALVNKYSSFPRLVALPLRTKSALDPGSGLTKITTVSFSLHPPFVLASTMYCVVEYGKATVEDSFGWLI